MSHSNAQWIMFFTKLKKLCQKLQRLIVTAQIRRQIVQTRTDKGVYAIAKFNADLVVSLDYCQMCNHSDKKSEFYCVPNIPHKQLKSSHYTRSSLLTVAHHHLLKCKYIQLLHPHLVCNLCCWCSSFLLSQLISHSPGLELSLPLFSCLVSCFLFWCLVLPQLSLPLFLLKNLS